MTIEEMRNRKKELGYSNEALSRLSGVPFSTVQKIFSGATESPRQKTLQALEQVLQKSDKPGVSYSFTRNAQDSMVQETAAAYGKKRQGEYTLEDYYAIPDERRVELIDGEIFDMAAPSLRHQTILGELHLQFRACADAHGENCRVFLSPCDVQLDNDDKTMVQPDLFVVCREFDREKRCFSGAPDLTVEILSDATRAKDLLLQTYKYQNAGVREYWIIDPKEEQVLVYDFSEESLEPHKYPFTSVIPVAISDGKCQIDFARIKERLYV